MAFVVEAELFSSRTMREWDMIVRDVVEKVNLLFLQHEPSSDRVDRSIAPALVEEAAILVKAVEKVDVLLRSKPIKVSNLEIGPLIN